MNPRLIATLKQKAEAINPDPTTHPLIYSNLLLGVLLTETEDITELKNELIGLINETPSE